MLSILAPRGWTFTRCRSPPRCAFAPRPEARGHGGEAFTLRLRFSEEFPLRWEAPSDTGVTVTDGTLSEIAQVTDGENQEWTLTVTPAEGAGEVTVTHPATTDCAAEHAICNAGGGALAQAVSVRVGAEPEKVAHTLWSSTLTVGEFDFFGFIGSDFGGSLSSSSWSENGTSHTAGSVNLALFNLTYDDRGNELWIDFSPAPPDLDTLTLHVDGNAHALSEAVVQGTRFKWPVGDLAWTEDQRVFLQLVRTVEVAAPQAGITVYDTEVREGPNATLVFPVVLEPAATTEVSVNYATADGTATEGVDYEPASDTLTFDPGETEKTIVVQIIDDSHDEGMETLTLTLSEPAGAEIARGTAEGRIVNSDHMPKAWLARFGRTVAEQVIDAVDARLFSAPTPGTQMTLAGYALEAASEQDIKSFEEREAERRFEALARRLTGPGGGRDRATR